MMDTEHAGPTPVYLDLQGHAAGVLTLHQQSPPHNCQAGRGVVASGAPDLMPAAWETGAAKGQAVCHGPKQMGFTSLWAAGITVSKGNRRRQTQAARTKVGEMFTPNTHWILGEGRKDGKSWIRFSTGRRALTRRVFFNQTPQPHADSSLSHTEGKQTHGDLDCIEDSISVWLLS